MSSLSSSILGTRKERSRAEGALTLFGTGFCQSHQQGGQTRNLPAVLGAGGEQTKIRASITDLCGASLSPAVAGSLCAVAFYVTCLACVPSLSVVCLVKDTDLPPVSWLAISSSDPGPALWGETYQRVIRRQALRYLELSGCVV